MNAPQILDRELERIPKDVVFLSSASDPYQPVEARFKITRRCLEVLLRHDFPVTILTRSPLVLRDLDSLRRFRWMRVGFSISSVSDRFYEPGVVPLRTRLETLRKLHDYGITTWVSLAPIIPKLILLNDMKWLFKELRDAGVSAVSVGLLRFIGYEESRMMFEQKSGLSASEVMAGGNEVHQEVSRLARYYGLDGCDSVLGWRDKVEEKRKCTLDNFLNH